MSKNFNALILFVSFVFNVAVARSQPADSTIKILSAKHTYTYFQEKGSETFQVKEIAQTQYRNALPATLPLTVFYNDNSKINAFTCKVNNKSPKDFKPIDSYYSVKDIFYSDVRLWYFPLKAPANSTIDVYIEKTTSNPLYFNTIYFNDDYATEKNEIAIKIPRSMNVSFKEMNFDGFDIKKTTRYLSDEDADLIIYEALNLPRSENEPNEPGHSYIYPHLIALADPQKNAAKPVYFTSLQDQYNWYLKLTAALNQDKDPAIIQQAAEITKALTNDIDKIKAIFYWVQENIRYIAFEDGMAGFKPDQATEVLRKKYGDCKGMANLTKTLLKALEFDARLCWLGTNHIAYNYSTPSLAVDNHMICALIYKDKTYFLDATETYSALNEYAERIQGRQVLIEDGKNYLLKYIPATQANMNLDFQKMALTIKGNNLVGTAKHTWKGEEKGLLLNRVNSSKKEALQRDFISYLNNGDHNYEISALKLSDLNNFDQEVFASFNLNFKNKADVFDKSYYLSLDFDKEYDNAIIKASRKNDYIFPYKTNILKEIELQIPENYTVSVKPDDVAIKTQDYLFTITYEIKADKIIYKKNLQILNPRIKKANFSTWNNHIKTLTQSYNETITLSPKS